MRPSGTDLRAYLQLDDEVLELNVTPNRGDAMSVLGIAREVAALRRSALRSDAVALSMKVAPGLKDTFPVKLSAPDGLPEAREPRRARHQQQAAARPTWLRERLRRAGLRSISPVVDVTNYVLLELGQPMHAYDLDKLKGGLEARQATAGEPITLLDGKEIPLTTDVLVIADRRVPWAWPESWVGRARCAAPTPWMCCSKRHSSRRRPSPVVGGDMAWSPTPGSASSAAWIRSHQERAVERATQLLLQIAGGNAGPVHVVQDDGESAAPARGAAAPRHASPNCSAPRFADNDVKLTLESLGMRVLADGEGWLVTPPSHRFDITIEADLIEELARIVGFEAIAEADAIVGTKRASRLAEQAPVEAQALEILATRGYQEAITYAFVDPALQTKLFPGVVDAGARPTRSRATCRSCAPRCGRASSRPRWKISAGSRIASGCSSTARGSSSIR